MIKVGLTIDTEPKSKDIWKLFVVMLAGHLLVASFMIDNIMKWVFFGVAMFSFISVIFSD